MTLQIIPVSLLLAAIPAWIYWELTIWHRRRRGLLPPPGRRTPNRT